MTAPPSPSTASLVMLLLTLRRALGQAATPQERRGALNAFCQAAADLGYQVSVSETSSSAQASAPIPDLPGKWLMLSDPTAATSPDTIDALLRLTLWQAPGPQLWLEQLQLYADVAGLLESISDPAELLAQAADALVQQFADYCVIYRAENGAPLPLSVAHPDPEQAARLHAYLLRRPLVSTAPGSVRAVIQDRSDHRLTDLTSEQLRLAARDDEEYEFVRSLHFRSALQFALVYGDEVYGALTLARTERNFTAADQALGREVAARLAAALTQAELHARLRRSEAEHRLIFESLNDGVLLTTSSGEISTLNARAAQLLGLPEDAVGFKLTEVPGTLQGAHGQPIHPALVLQVLSQQTPEATPLSGLARLTTPDGQVRWLQVRLRGLPREGGAARTLMTLTDVTGTYQLQAQLEHLSLHDAATGLPNRAHFLKLADQWAQSPGRTLCALRVLDMAPVLALHGEQGLRQYLYALASRLLTALPEGSVLGRVSEHVLAFVTERGAGLTELLGQLTQTLPAGEVALRPHLAAGQRLWSDDAPVALALADAEAAAEQAQQVGGPAVIVDRGQADRYQARVRLGRRLRDALERRQLSVHYQPVLDLKSGLLVGAEALARWTDEERGPVSPAEFIPLAEALGLMPSLTRLVLLRANRLASWASEQLGRPLRVAVNISAGELHAPEFTVRAERFLAAYPVAASQLEIEVTEQTLIQALPRVGAMLRALQAGGLSVALDDFGTGFSSLAVLQQLPVNKLKLDRSFVQGLEDDPRQRVLTQAVIDLAGQLDITVVAEGVETAGQLQLLRTMRCDQVQGFYLSRPLDTQTFQARLHTWPQTMQALLDQS
ncbi:putative bifunctional diguanylate cyclase/phosphodiesterase [Deinococcus arboris]|nr:EAL domain-containing protein [Deinococcus arboris]